MVSDSGITEDAIKAKFLIIIKTYGDTSFERLEYNFGGPMKRRITYSDSELKVKNGNFANFSAKGILISEGNYRENKKDGSWFLYNEVPKVILEYKYHLDTLLQILNTDSLINERKKIKADTIGEHEAAYRGGEKKYLNYIYSNLKIPERTLNLNAEGTVRVRFIIDEQGKVTNVRISKSVEFALDEEAMRVVSSAKDWLPASIKDKKVKAYREQPITVSFK